MPFRIERLWAFVAVDPEDGDEGLIGETLGRVFMPFVAGDERRVADFRARVPLLPLPTGLTVKLVRFDVRTEVETLRTGGN